MNTNFFKITRASGNTQRLSGLLAVAAKAGMAVQSVTSGSASAAAHDDLGAKWQLHTGIAGRVFFLNRNVTTNTSVPLEDIVFANGDVNDVLSTQPVDAVEALEIEAEGGDTDADGLAIYLDTTTAQAISSGTAAETKLTLVGGKWGIVTDRETQAVAGRLVKQLTPQTASNVRILIEVYAEARLDEIV